MFRATKIALSSSLRAKVSSHGRLMTTKVPATWSGDAQPNDAELARMYLRTLNDIPVPAGSWSKQYSAKNSKYNIQLGANVVVLLGTIILMFQTEAIYLHWGPKFQTMNIDPTTPTE